MKLDSTPGRVDLVGYAGDTLTVTITAPDTLVAGKVWAAQVRATRDPGAPVDATFTITPPAVADGPAYVVLAADDTALLAATGEYAGQWDCQVSNAVETRTLAQGSITIKVDVTQP